jgi:hypothetical protein
LTHHAGSLAQRELEKHFDRQAELDGRIGEHRRTSRSTVTRRALGQSLSTQISKDPRLRSDAL